MPRKPFAEGLILPASVAGEAPFQLPHGTAPSAPADGDVWTTTAGVFARINGATVGPLGTGGGGGGGVTISDTAPGSPTAGDMWWESDTGLMFVYYDSTWVEVGGGAGPAGPIGQSALPWTKTGVLTTVTGGLGFPMPFAGTILGVSARVGTAPTGASILVDVNKNGTTIFTNQANRPAIVASALSTAAEVTNMDVTSFAAGDYLTVDIDQVGSTIAGSDIVVVIRYRDAYGAGVTPSGLTLVTPTSIANSGGSSSASGGEVTFTGVTTMSLNGCFSSSYDAYRVIIKATGSTSNGFSVRLRVAGTDAATNYERRGVYGGASGPANVNTTGGTEWGFGAVTTTTANLVVCDLSSVALAASTQASANILDASGYGIFCMAVHTTATAYDGLTFYANSGSITGTVRVYGYQNA